VGDNCRGDKEATSLGSQVTFKDIDWNVAPDSRTKKGYSDVVAERPGNMPFDNKIYKLFVKTKNSQSAEYTKTLFKSKVTPTQMKVVRNQWPQNAEERSVTN
jgi:hypothetical protein